MQETEVVDAYRRGASMKALAQQHGVSVHTIRRILTDAGEPRRPAGRPRLPVSSEDVAELYDAGISWEDISARLGIPRRSARHRYDEIRSQRGQVRRGLWHQVLAEALHQHDPVPVLPTVTVHLGRQPTANEARAARRAAHDLARRGEAIISHEPVTWQGQRAPLLVLHSPST